jgi:hypothetical protein
MRIEMALVCLLSMSGIGGALAAEAFFIVKDKDASTCRVVTEKPTTPETILVNEVIYPTELEAKDAITKLEACRTG